MSSIRICYLWEMGLMVKTAELERMRERRIKELRKCDDPTGTKYRVSDWVSLQCEGGPQTTTEE